jgi:hypothetical protein
MENDEIKLLNLGILTSKIPENLLMKLKTECFDFINKNKMISNLTSSGVAEHYYLEDNNVELFNFLKDWVKTYLEKYKYPQSAKILNKNDPPLIFTSPWFNIQKKGQFIPSHTHSGILSYTIWVQIPDLNPINNNKYAGCFEMQCHNILGERLDHHIILDKHAEGKFILFPSSLHHAVYPFFDNDEFRISISGNICFDNTGTFKE